MHIETSLVELAMKQVEAVSKVGEAIREAAEEVVGEAKQELTRATRRTRKHLAAQTRQAAEALASNLEPATRRQARRWPWIVGLLVAAAGAAALVVLSRRPKEVRLEDVREDEAVTIPEPSRGERQTENGRVSR
ncbi:hypothetical protein GCM10010174_32640 [Kutzneria viridogrisea]|uniref:NADH dehydrogenase/NADH:ubiquinone oxidoreductase subunit G n=2 Tax=Kutzneria TaxID=43356 RepID=A0ABR6BQR5_9PSEU|nr:hypothetical protein [Kutzneria albida]AHH93390.1 putative membrane protein [Kutzneria albida DSM 43870]MBA8929225.1 NADH dehydrogenase/NADH:ubiquinone oxidoreductase subunit G [Kutzneria viridogrisea]